VPRVVVRELELDLDAFEGPFDLLLTLVLKEELDLAEIDVAGIVLTFVERLAERGELDLEACGEFLVLVAALLELKARGLFPDEEAELSELEPEEAASPSTGARRRRQRGWRNGWRPRATASSGSGRRRSRRGWSADLRRRSRRRSGRRCGCWPRSRRPSRLRTWSCAFRR
jgi:segregation and condensation protein A